MVLTHMHAKGQGQSSLGSKVRVKTDGPTDGSNYVITRSVIIFLILVALQESKLDKILISR